MRGQYGAGAGSTARQVPGYREEQGVDPALDAPRPSSALKLFIDNWRWQDVPFYLRTGKRLPERASEVVHPVPAGAAPGSFPSAAIGEMEPNPLPIRIQPRGGHRAALPGQAARARTCALARSRCDFTYKEAFDAEPPEAYETLLLDVIKGDQTQFMRRDQVEEAWEIVMPILEYWEDPGHRLPELRRRHLGPRGRHVLIARDGRMWVEPDGLEEEEEDKE